MIQLAILAANLLTALCSALAAYHWYRASQVKDPPSALVGYAGFGSSEHPRRPNAGVDASPLVEWAQESGKRNKTAALWSAAAAALAGLGWALGLFIPNA
jgi:hypothetical protein